MRDATPCLRLIEERFLNAIKHNLPDQYIDLVFEAVFPQIWGSTALGFGGIGGRAMTTAYTTVISADNFGYWGVFFGERLAYTVLNPNQTFFDHMFKERKMASVKDHHIYSKRGDEEDA